MQERPKYSTPQEIKQMNLAMRLSVAVGLFMFLTKIFAFLITNSTAILSDAAESIVHILAVAFAAYSLKLSLKPADDTHPYGHDRISFFSAGFEGAMIIIAAVYIIYEAITKWMTGLALENIGLGTLFTIIATVVNAALGWYLIRLGKKYRSIVLEANGKHVLTDSWTSLGVIVGLVLTMITGWLPFDPILAILVALNILWTGFGLIHRSIGGLMDAADPKTQKLLRQALDEETAKYQIQYHDLRHRNAGNKVLVEFHLLFPEHMAIAQAHEIATRIEMKLYEIPSLHLEILTHLEPLEGHDEIHQGLFKQSKSTQI